MACKVRCQAETQRPHKCLHFRAEDYTRRLALRVANHCCDVPTQQEDALSYVFDIDSRLANSASKFSLSQLHWECASPSRSTKQPQLDDHSDTYFSK